MLKTPFLNRKPVVNRISPSFESDRITGKGGSRKKDTPPTLGARQEVRAFTRTEQPVLDTKTSNLLGGGWDSNVRPTKGPGKRLAWLAAYGILKKSLEQGSINCLRKLHPVEDSQHGKIWVKKESRVTNRGAEH